MAIIPHYPPKIDMIGLMLGAPWAWHRTRGKGVGSRQIGIIPPYQVSLNPGSSKGSVLPFAPFKKEPLGLSKLVQLVGAPKRALCSWRVSKQDAP